VRTLPALLICLLAAISPPAQGSSGPVLELQAAEVVVRGGGRIIEARGDVRITDGRSTVRAGEAVYAVKERRIRLGAGVVIRTAEGSLESAEAIVLLSADRRLSRIEASGGVELKTGDRVLRAGQLRYLVGGSQASAAGNVTLFLPPDVLAAGPQLTLHGGAATLTGGAKIQSRDGIVESDTMELSDVDQVAQLRGNVRSTWQATRITAATATVYLRERRAVFRDQVTITGGGRTMRTTLVTIYYAERRMVAEGATTIRLEEGGP